MCPAAQTALDNFFLAAKGYTQKDAENKSGEVGA